MPAVPSLRRSLRLRARRAPPSVSPARRISAASFRNALPLVLERITSLADLLHFYEAIPEVRRYLYDPENFSQVLNRFQRPTPFISNLQAGNLVGNVNLTRQEVGKLLGRSRQFSESISFLMDPQHPITLEILQDYMIPPLAESEFRSAEYSSDWRMTLIGYNDAKLIFLWERYLNDKDLDSEVVYHWFEFDRQRYVHTIFDNGNAIELDDAFEEALSESMELSLPWSNSGDVDLRAYYKVLDILPHDDNNERHYYNRLNALENAFRGDRDCRTIANFIQHFQGQNVQWVLGKMCN